MTAFPRRAIAQLIISGKSNIKPAIEEKVWGLNLDQIESGTGKILEKNMAALSELGPSTYPFAAGTVLYSKLRPYLNKVIVAEEDGYATTELVAMRCDLDQVFPDYLAYYLRSPEFLSFANRVVAGAKMPRMVMSEFWKYEIPLPPLPEQRRIVAMLDKADALRAKRREAITKLDQLLQSVFLEMFGDPVTNPKGWPETKFLGDVADICSGITKGRRTTDDTQETPYLAVANVQDRHLKLDSVKTIWATDAEIERYRLAVNDLLLTEGGDPDKLGRGALWDGSIRDCIHQNHVFRVRINSPSISPIFLNWLVGSARGKRYFLSVSKQTTGIASINMTQLKKFPLLIPPIELQVHFALAVSKIEAHQQELEKARDSAEQLFQSIQQQAFAGTL
ncbi:restriction endonuclease subunit S [Halopseudomonas sabulinigri]|uniref:Type I restriction modification DNA specificity domain-containing protein n=1 Tax=Halopseudomonas sabulinigri TaxID=472181 RepID=A0ABP9ZKQ0_9GAMM